MRDVNEAGYSRIYNRMHDDSTFAVIGSKEQVEDSEGNAAGFRDRTSDLYRYVQKWCRKHPGCGFNEAECTYTYDDGTVRNEDVLIIYDISEQDAVAIGKKTGQKRILRKDGNFIGYIYTDGRGTDTAPGNSDCGFTSDVKIMYPSLNGNPTYESFQIKYNKESEQYEAVVSGITDEKEEEKHAKTAIKCSELGSIIRNELTGSPDKAPPCPETGYGQIDSLISIEGANLIMIGSRPGIGKSVFALNLARNIALNHNKVLFFSLELTEKQIAKKYISILTDMPADETSYDPDIPEEEERESARSINGELLQTEILINDSHKMSPSGIRQTISQAMPDADCIIIDYLQLMSADSECKNRSEEVAGIMTGLRKISEDFGIPVICFSNMSRPQDGAELSVRDFRESEAIIDESDVVMILTRPDEITMKVNVVRNRENKFGKAGLYFKPEDSLQIWNI